MKARAKIESSRSLDTRFFPNYSYGEAALYLDLPVSTVRAWVRGTGAFRPVIEAPRRDTAQLSFVNLVEMYVLSAIRRVHKISMPRTRKAIAYAKRELRVPHPLASLDIRTDDKDLFVKFLGQIIDMSGQPGQFVIPEIVEAHLARIERDGDRFAVRFFPFSRNACDVETLEKQPKSIVIDPQIAFGRPVIFGTGIPTRIIAERFKFGESFDSLASDYFCDVALVEEAIRYEQRVAA